MATRNTSLSTNNQRIAAVWAASGFTLIELTLAISIFALLVGPLTPTLSKAHDSARSMACPSDLRQLPASSNACAGDYKDQLPLPDWGPQAQTTGSLREPSANLTGLQASDRRTGSLWNCVEHDDVHRCVMHDKPISDSEKQRPPS